MNNNSYISGYVFFFNELLSIVANHDKNKQLGEAITKHALSFINRWNPTDFEHIGDTYTRCYIGKDNASGWEAIVMCWERGDQTSIHGHPDFASYTFLQGEMLVETYALTSGSNVIKKAEYLHHQGDSLFAIGKPNKFDNYIHRLTCLSPSAYSLHIYSDDAGKGKKFSLAE